MAEQTKTRLSAAEFEALPESRLPTELIEGELVVRGVPSVKHQRVTGALYRRLSALTPDGEVFIAPVSVRLDDTSYFQPDVLWVAAGSVCEVTDGGLNGPPDLVVEVISPGTARVDRGVKFQTYQRFGVREYWLVEPELAFLEVWVLRDGLFVQHGVYEADATLESPALGQSVDLHGIFPK